MEVRLRYFAVIRELLGRGEETRRVDDGMTAGALFDLVAAETPRLAAMKPATMLMVNQEFVPPDRVLLEGDELALIPPVSGGETESRRFVVQTDALDPRRLEAVIADDGAGAVVTFTGTVRDNARGRAVVALDYEAYAAAAEKMLEQIGREIEERWGLRRVAISHRTGRLVVGEASVVIAVAAAHRGEAFAACAYAIERIKEIVPIWKKEHYADGAIWVGSEAEYQRDVRAPSDVAG
jgi:molybdopterin synthase catalytic subunit